MSVYERWTGVRWNVEVRWNRVEREKRWDGEGVYVLNKILATNTMVQACSLTSNRLVEINIGVTR